MCDTLGKLNIKEGYSLFAKNSDRQHDEPQVMVYIKEKNQNNHNYWNNKRYNENKAE